MKNITQLFRCFSGIVLACVPIITIASPPDINWEEEVQLHDGKIIIVRRHEELGVSGLPLAHRGSRKFWHFCYPPMNIQWKSKPEYFPEVFDIVDGKAYVRVTIANCISCDLHDYPETSALYFMWENGAWKKVDYKRFPPGLRVNILATSHYDDDGSRDVHGLVTIAQKKEMEPEMYWLMRKKPEIVGLNDQVIFNGKGKPPTYVRETCNKCKGEKTAYYGGKPSSDVFLSTTPADCR